MKKSFLLPIIAVVSVVGIGVALFMLKTHAQSKANATAQLNQDLIQSKVTLEGWQEENAHGNLTLAGYRNAFATDLQSMHNAFEVDYQAQ